MLNSSTTEVEDTPPPTASYASYYKLRLLQVAPTTSYASVLQDADRPFSSLIVAQALDDMILMLTRIFFFLYGLLIVL